MKCPKCGNELRRSKKDPNYGLCDNCRKKYKWVDDYEDDYDEDEDYIAPKPAKRKGSASTKPHSKRKKKKNNGMVIGIVIGVVILIVAAVIVIFFIKGGDKNKDKESRPRVNQEDQQDSLEDTTPQEPEQEQPQVAPEPTDLTGIWKSEANEGSWMEASISVDTISIDWVSDEGNTRSIYWVGSYTAPTEYVENYTWTSQRNTEQTDNALLASTDDTKDFSYSSGKLSYSVSLMGTTTQMELSR